MFEGLHACSCIFSPAFPCLQKPSTEGHRSRVARIRLEDLYSHLHALLTETCPVELQSSVCRRHTGHPCMYTHVNTHTHAVDVFTSLHMINTLFSPSFNLTPIVSSSPSPPAHVLQPQLQVFYLILLSSRVVTALNPRPQRNGGSPTSCFHRPQHLEQQMSPRRCPV